MQAMYTALARLGVPAEATVLEPGCGIGNFLAHAPADMRFIGVELEAFSVIWRNFGRQRTQPLFNKHL